MREIWNQLESNLVCQCDIKPWFTPHLAVACLEIFGKVEGASILRMPCNTRALLWSPAIDYNPVIHVNLSILSSFLVNSGNMPPNLAALSEKLNAPFLGATNIEIQLTRLWVGSGVL